MARIEEAFLRILSRREFLYLGAGAAIGASYSHSARARPAPLPLTGVNLSGAEGGALPGVYAHDYIYPHSELIDYYISLGFNVIRLPFRWERLQPNLSGPFAEAEQKQLTNLSAYISARGANIILDPHNYARRALASDSWNSFHLIGSREVPALAFADFWRRLAALFKDNPRVIFGLMNEPFDIAPPIWLSIVNKTIAAIRAEGAGNLILAPGVAFSGAHSWISAGNGAMAGIEDPAKNFAIEVHQYLDTDSSGTHPDAVSRTIGSERIRAFEAWARKHNLRAFLGEFGASQDQTSLAALTDLLTTLEESPDIWLGWTAWAGGSWWPENYMFNLDAVKGAERPQTKILASFAKQGRG